MAAILNEISFQNKMGKALNSKRFGGIAFNAANTRFVAAKENLINEYSESEITKEINEGAGASSNILPKGNIYSFMGFELGDRPAIELQNFLQQNIKIFNNPSFRNNIQKNRVFYEFPVQSPTLRDIYENEQFATPENWSNKSWIYLIENGVNNFAYFIYHEFFGDYSRSKTGLQAEHPKKGAKNKVLGIPWISKILNNFKSRIRGEKVND
jgi:hypothetical protein